MDQVRPVAAKRLSPALWRALRSLLTGEIGVQRRPGCSPAAVNLTGSDRYFVHPAVRVSEFTPLYPHQQIVEFLHDRAD